MPRKIEVDGEKTVSTFNKEQILQSTRYAVKRDLLTVLLKNGKCYSHDDVARLIDDFEKGKVK